jgi:hypothetical protein
VVDEEKYANKSTTTTTTTTTAKSNAPFTVAIDAVERHAARDDPRERVVDVNPGDRHDPRQMEDGDGDRAAAVEHVVQQIVIDGRDQHRGVVKLVALAPALQSIYKICVCVRFSYYICF